MRTGAMSISKIDLEKGGPQSIAQCHVQNGVLFVYITYFIVLSYFHRVYTFGRVFGKRDLLAIFHVMKTNLIAEKIPFQMLQTIFKYS